MGFEIALEYILEGVVLLLVLDIHLFFGDFEQIVIIEDFLDIDLLLHLFAVLSGGHLEINIAKLLQEVIFERVPAERGVRAVSLVPQGLDVLKLFLPLDDAIAIVVHFCDHRLHRLPGDVHLG